MNKTNVSTKIECSSFDELSRVVNSTLNQHIFILFSGDVDQKTGLSWCPDCNKCYPIIEKVCSKLDDRVLLITCYVGNKAKWRSSENDFRKDSPFKIERIPTLLDLRTGQQIIEEDVANLDTVAKFLSE